MKLITHVFLLFLVMVTVGCSSTSNSTAGGGGGTSRVFFIEPTDGATVKSPVHLRFGVENVNISPVPPGDITTARPGMMHHHVGVDQDCLPRDTTIVKGTPSWVHFGDGKTEMDLQLPPGMHKLSLQLGDDLHKTQDNLCQTITVNVTE